METHDSLLCLLPSDCSSLHFLLIERRQQPRIAHRIGRVSYNVLTMRIDGSYYMFCCSRQEGGRL